MENHEANAATNSGLRTSTASHTPGPWRVERSPNRRVLCVFGGPHFDTWICGELQADNETRIDTGECVANARLIAAAPRLLLALQNIVANARMQPDTNMNGATDCYAVPLDDLEDARAAITAAVGDRESAPASTGVA